MIRKILRTQRGGMEEVSVCGVVVVGEGARKTTSLPLLHSPRG